MPSPEWTIASLVAWTTEYFRRHGIDSPRLDAELLVAHALGLRRIDLYLRHDQPLNDGERTRIKDLLRRRVAREPVAYIIGRREFWSLDLEVSPAVLIPRPETEGLVTAALDLLAKPGGGRRPRMVDLGTGSGAIAIALATSRPDAAVWASDRSLEALAVARRNAHRHGVDARIQFLAADWLAPFPSAPPGFDVVAANPPYIPSAQLAGLEPEVRDFEPRVALDGAEDGLACLERIITDARRVLAPEGHLLLELGFDQSAAVAALLTRAGFGEIRFHRDYAGHLRVAQAHA
jgi:release factor glutamine methyltransferase